MNNQKEKSQIIEGAIEAQQPAESKELEVRKNLQPMTLEEKVQEETHNRAVLTKFITDHMKKGVDYAPIHINKTCQNKYDCQNKYHFSKDNLTKAGAEKIRSLLRLRPETVKDSDTWEMAGSKPGLFCYRCNLYDVTTGALIGDGLGACDASEKMNNVNNAIKIAKKRAFVDAILSTGSLSDFFTQDLEDLSENEVLGHGVTVPKQTYNQVVGQQPMTSYTMAQQKENAQTPTRPTNTSSKATTSSQSNALNNYPISKAQLDWIEKQMKAKGITMDAVERVIEDITQNKKSQLIKLTNPEADMLIKRLLKAPNKKASSIKVDEQESEQITNEVADGLEEQEA